MSGQVGLLLFLFRCSSMARRSKVWELQGSGKQVEEEARGLSCTGTAHGHCFWDPSLEGVMNMLVAHLPASMTGSLKSCSVRGQQRWPGGSVASSSCRAHETRQAVRSYLIVISINWEPCEVSALQADAKTLAAPHHHRGNVYVPPELLFASDSSTIWYGRATRRCAD